jgi:two-component SAPR family response regulator
MRFKEAFYILIKLIRSYILINSLILLLMLSSQGLFAQSYGLHFFGHEVSLDQRTQLYLTPDKPLPISSSLTLSFKVKMEEGFDDHFGYIFRLVLGDKSIDMMNVLPISPNNFQLTFSGQESNHTISIPLTLHTSEWLDFNFVLDIDNQKLTCKVKDVVLEEDIEDFSAKEGVQLFFGAHTHGRFPTTDVCQMTIKDVKVSSRRKNYYWPLDQMEGNVVIEKNHKANGWVENPNWLRKSHNQWENIASLEFPGYVKTASNPKEGLLYIASSKSIEIMDVSNDNSTVIDDYKSPHKMLSSNHLVFDTINNDLISYSLRENYLHYYNFETKTWSDFPSDTLSFTTHWHHNKIITPDGDLYTFGGYGLHLYKNHVKKWNSRLERFDTVVTSGEFYPRYLAGGGYNHHDSLYYLIGGYGSKTGIQAVNPDYYYEILSYSFKDSVFNRVYECKEYALDFCFAGSVVIDDSSNLYGLRFSKHQFKNKLQLVKIPLHDPKIILLGSPIDYSFVDVKSSAELYYYPSLQKMLAVTTYLDENVSKLEIYSIAFPPQAYTKAIEKISNSRIKSIGFILGGILAVIMAIIIPYLIRRKRKVSSDKEGVGLDSVILPKKPEKTHGAREISVNSIILFGGFQIIDKDGKDITGSFTPLLKKLLLFILLNSLKHNKGVSSNLLYETFWFDKSIDSARNNRAVNIVKLRTLLEKVGICNITKDTGYWKFEMEPGSLYIDYLDYLNIVSNNDPLSKDDIHRLLTIIERGAFLRNIEDDWLDVFKSDVSNDIIDKLAEFIRNSDSDPDFILQLTNCMFMFDMVSEEAMTLQCSTLVKLGKHSLAKKAYEKFLKEYKLLYGEDYDKSFISIIADKKM